MKGRVIKHARSLVLRDCKCKVSKAGRARVLREKRKNVHAGIEGTLVDQVPCLRLAEQVTYNPYKYETFVKVSTLAEVHQATWMRFADKRLYM